MPKKPNTPKNAEPAPLAAATNPAEKAAPKPAPKKAAKAKVTELKSAKTTPTRTRVKAVAITEPAVSITPADIALRAYFIAEKRQKLGLPGDSTSDWVEAEYQLRTEAKLKAKK